MALALLTLKHTPKKPKITFSGHRSEQSLSLHIVLEKVVNAVEGFKAFYIEFLGKIGKCIRKNWFGK